MRFLAICDGVETEHDTPEAAIDVAQDCIDSAYAACVARRWTREPNARVCIEIAWTREDISDYTTEDEDGEEVVREDGACDYELEVDCEAASWMQVTEAVRTDADARIRDLRGVIRDQEETIKARTERRDAYAKRAEDLDCALYELRAKMQAPELAAVGILSDLDEWALLDGDGAARATFPAATAADAVREANARLPPTPEARRRRLVDLLRHGCDDLVEAARNGPLALDKAEAHVQALLAALRKLETP